MWNKHRLSDTVTARALGGSVTRAPSTACLRALGNGHPVRFSRQPIAAGAVECLRPFARVHGVPFTKLTVERFVAAHE